MRGNIKKSKEVRWNSSGVRFKVVGHCGLTLRVKLGLGLGKGRDWNRLGMARLKDAPENP
eukprot:1319064-Amorphochlora_amoeboformis.AAC.1